MTYTNSANKSELIGRLTGEPKPFVLSNGTTVYRFSVAYNIDTADANGEYPSRLVPLQSFVNPERPNAPITRAHTGDLVHVIYESYLVEIKDRDENGNPLGTTHLDFRATTSSVRFLEPQSVRAERFARKRAQQMDDSVVVEANQIPTEPDVVTTVPTESVSPFDISAEQPESVDHKPLEQTDPSLGSVFSDSYEPAKPIPGYSPRITPSDETLL